MPNQFGALITTLGMLLYQYQYSESQYFIAAPLQEPLAAHKGYSVQRWLILWYLLFSSNIQALYKSILKCNWLSDNVVIRRESERKYPKKTLVQIFPQMYPKQKKKFWL